MDRQISVGLQVFNGLLARSQGGNLGFKTGDILDLGIKTPDLGLQQLISPLLIGNLGLEPEKNNAGEQTTRKGGQPQTSIKNVFAKFARSFAMRQ
jgi:hypothetical protein